MRIFKRNKYELSGKEVKEILTNANESVEEEIESNYASFIEKVKKLNFGHLMAMFKHIERKIEDLEDVRDNYFEAMAHLDKNAEKPVYPKEIEDINLLKVQRIYICREMSRRMIEKYQANKDEQTF